MAVLFKEGCVQLVLATLKDGWPVKLSGDGCDMDELAGLTDSGSLPP